MQVNVVIRSQGEISYADFSARTSFIILPHYKAIFYYIFIHFHQNNGVFVIALPELLFFPFCISVSIVSLFHHTADCSFQGRHHGDIWKSTGFPDTITIAWSWCKYMYFYKVDALSANRYKKQGILRKFRKMPPYLSYIIVHRCLHILRL